MGRWEVVPWIHCMLCTQRNVCNHTMVLPHSYSTHSRTQLPARDGGVLYPPAVITHCPPRVIDVHLHVARTETTLGVIRGMSAID